MLAEVVDSSGCIADASFERVLLRHTDSRAAFLQGPNSHDSARSHFGDDCVDAAWSRGAAAFAALGARGNERSLLGRGSSCFVERIEDQQLTRAAVRESLQVQLGPASSAATKERARLARDAGGKGRHLLRTNSVRAAPQRARAVRCCTRLRCCARFARSSAMGRDLGHEEVIEQASLRDLDEEGSRSRSVWGSAVRTWLVS